jgi:hypothetical protein
LHVKLLPYVRGCCAPNTASRLGEASQIYMDLYALSDGVLHSPASNFNFIIHIHTMNSYWVCSAVAKAGYLVNHLLDE